MKGSLPSIGRKTYFTKLVVRLCSRSFPSLIPDIKQPGTLSIIKHTSRHHLPQGVPWLLCSQQRDAIASIRHRAVSTSITDSSGVVYLSGHSQAQLNTVTEQNTGLIGTAACHGSLVHEIAVNKLGKVPGQDHGVCGGIFLCLHIKS